MAYNPNNPNGQAAMANSQPIVIASNQSPVSVAGTLNITGNPSISGTVNIGTASGSVVAFQGTSPWIITGSVQGTFSPAANQSVSGTIIANQGTTPWVITGSVQGSFSPSGNQSVSGTVGASIIGSVPVVVQSSVATVIIGGSIAASFTPPANQSVSGSINVSSIFSIPGIISTANSTTSVLGLGLAFTGTSEEVKDFASINITVFTDQASATDGLSLQQSSDGTNWDITDTYTIPASTGKTFSVQPAARFFRIVYTNGGIIQTAFRLQTIFHKVAAQSSSQRPTDGYTNETDLIQGQAFGMVYNGATWDRLRGNVAAGVLINPGSSSIFVLQTGTQITSVSGVVNISGSVVGFQGGTQITSISGGISSVALVGANTVSVVGTIGASIIGTVPVTQTTNPWIIGSIVGTYSEDVPSTGADKGLFTLGIRNDTVASLIGTDLDYTGWSTDSAGRHLVKPFSADESRLDTVSSVVSSSVTALFPSVIGLRNYVTDIMIANTGSVATLITFKDGSTSILGFTIAPAGSGSNINGMAFPLRTAPAQDFTYSVAPSSSVLYVTAKGYKAP